MRTNAPSSICALLAVLPLAASPLCAEVVFSHDFNGGEAGLNGTPVDAGAGSWTAANVVRQDGAFSTGPGSATLPFVPENGRLYSLDARVTGVAGTADWVALGFANGQSSASSANDRFIINYVVGTAWLLFRGANGVHKNTSFLGLGTFGVGNHGLTSPAEWEGPLSNANGGDVDLRVLLDTTGGSGTWTATMLAKRPAAADYTVVRPTAAVLNEAITSQDASDWERIGPFKLPDEAIGNRVRIEWLFTGTDAVSAFLGPYIDHVEIREN